jgi:hypothetical protein
MRINCAFITYNKYLIFLLQYCQELYTGLKNTRARMKKNLMKIWLLRPERKIRLVNVALAVLCIRQLDPAFRHGCPGSCRS